MGWFLEANDIDDLPLPEAMVRRPTLRLSLSVAHYKPEGSPWGAYAVLAVTTNGLVASHSSEGLSGSF